MVVLWSFAFVFLGWLFRWLHVEGQTGLIPLLMVKWLDDWLYGLMLLWLGGGFGSYLVSWMFVSHTHAHTHTHTHTHTHIHIHM